MAKDIIKEKRKILQIGKNMKVYLIMHKGKPSRLKTESWSIVYKVGTNGIFVEAVNAFLRKKDAKKFIEDNNLEHLTIKTFQNIK